MKMLGNSRGVAAVLAMTAISMGVSVSPAFAQEAAKPAAPAAKPAGSAAPAAKPAAPAAKPATPAPAPAGATAKPAAPAPKDTAAAKPAAPKKNEDKTLLASGQKKLDAGDHAGALADFEASYAAKASPEAQRGIALAHDKLGHFPEAVAAYEKFAAEATPKMKTETEEAQKRVEAIKAMPGKVHLESTPPGATVVVDPPADGAPAGTGSTATAPATEAAAAQPAAAPQARTTPVDLDLAPGKHKVRLTSEGFEPAEKDVDVTFASKQDVKVDLVAKPPPPPPAPVAAVPAPAPAPPPPPPLEERSKVPAIVTGAVALAAAGVGTVFGLKALSQSNDYDKTPTTKLADDGENNALVADMMFGVAITFGVTSAVLFLSSDSPQQAKAASPTTASIKPKATKPTGLKVVPAPYVTPTGGGAGAVVKF